MKELDPPITISCQLHLTSIRAPAKWVFEQAKGQRLTPCVAPSFLLNLLIRISAGKRVALPIRIEHCYICISRTVRRWGSGGVDVATGSCLHRRPLPAHEYLGAKHEV